MRTSDTPVLIVGGGAAGTMLSLQLARHAVEARTIDRAPSPARVSKAITVHARTVEILERIDPKLAGRFLSDAIHNKGYVLHFVDDAGRRSEVRPGLDFTKLEGTKYPYLLVHGQNDTERLLRDYLKEQHDRSTEWGVECTDVEHTADGVLATLRHADGSEERVHSRYLVACDGMNSRVRRALGLAQVESDYAGTKMQNMDVYLRNFPDVEDYVHYCAGTDHFIMIVKLPGGFYRLLLSDRGEAADPNVAPERAFLNLIDRHFDGVTFGDIVWHSRWESWVRLANTYRDRNVFLAGDSAHVHSTTGGQGMNCCLQDSYNLGWKLGFVLSGIASEALLDSYETERRPIAEQVIWAASSLHEIFMGHGKSIAQRRTRIDDPAFLEAVVGRCSGLSYTYRDSVPPLDAAQGLTGPAVGDRAIDVPLGDGGTLLAATNARRYTLLAVRSGDAPATLTAELAAIAERHRNGLDVRAVRGSPEFAARYGAEPREQLLLIRPDGYIGGRGPLGAAGALDRYLTNEVAPGLA